MLGDLKEQTACNFHLKIPFYIFRISPATFNSLLINKVHNLYHHVKQSQCTQHPKSVHSSHCSHSGIYVIIEQKEIYKQSIISTKGNSSKGAISRNGLLQIFYNIIISTLPKLCIV